jgi:hypothetical protein
MIAQALAFAEAGIPIFPVRLYLAGDRWLKRPHIINWSARATSDLTQITEWWELWPQAIVGVPLARVGLVCIDADRHASGPDGVALLPPLPPHPVVVTKSGGEHHFFAQPTPPIRFARWAGGEVLGEGRFVVGYSVAPFVADAPVWPNPELPKRHTSRERNTPARPITLATASTITHPLAPTQSVLLRSKYLLRNVERAQPDNRHNLVYWAACRFGNMIGEGKIKPAIAEQLLFQAAQACGVWDNEHLRATIRDGLRTGEEEWADAVLKGRAGVVDQPECGVRH